MHLTKCSPREPVANLAKRFGIASGTLRSATRGHYVWQDCSSAGSLRNRRHFRNWKRNVMLQQFLGPLTGAPRSPNMRTYSVTNFAQPPMTRPALQTDLVLVVELCILGSTMPFPCLDTKSSSRSLMLGVHACRSKKKHLFTLGDGPGRTSTNEAPILHCGAKRHRDWNGPATSLFAARGVQWAVSPSAGEKRHGMVNCFCIES